MVVMSSGGWLMKGSAIPGSLTATLEGDRTQHYTRTLRIQYIHVHLQVH